MKVYVDPAFNALYATFYYKGLRDLYGKNNVILTSKPFSNLHYQSETHIFAFVVEGRKYAIDFADSNDILYEDFLSWADVYAKVNYNSNFIPPCWQNKVVKCGPNYSIGLTNNKYIAALQCVKHYLLCHRRVDYSFAKYLSRYIMSSKRKTLVELSCEKEKYIFFVSTLWWGQEKVNKARINFIRACLELQKEGKITFEGGLIPDAQQNTDGIKDIIFKDRIPYNEYMLKLSQSSIAFNTPAYFDCHGWKLPEYMSMNKVILSTPFVNELPVPLKHKENIYFVEDTEVSTIKKSIMELLQNNDLYNNIKLNIKEYYNRNIREDICVDNLVKAKQ
ncbi:MAG: hypothetical protein IJ834_01010 [Paludibacteraceae bacterium]|nr:hypothetical protein [Paludibacteraceae bacterium]